MSEREKAPARRASNSHSYLLTGAAYAVGLYRTCIRQRDIPTLSRAELESASDLSAVSMFLAVTISRFTKRSHTAT